MQIIKKLHGIGQKVRSVLSSEDTGKYFEMTSRELKEFSFTKKWLHPTVNTELAGETIRRGSFVRMPTSAFSIAPVPVETVLYTTDNVVTISDFEIPRTTIAVRGKYQEFPQRKLARVSLSKELSASLDHKGEFPWYALSLEQVKLPLVQTVSSDLPLPGTWVRTNIFPKAKLIVEPFSFPQIKLETKYPFVSIKG